MHYFVQALFVAALFVATDSIQAQTFQCLGVLEESTNSSKYFPALVDDDCALLLADDATRAGLPLVTIQVNWHFVQDANNPPQYQWNTSVANFNPISLSASYTSSVNSELADLIQAKIVNGSPLHDAVIGDSRIRFQIATNTSNVSQEVAEGIFIWPNLAAFEAHYSASTDNLFHIVANGGVSGPVGATAYTFYNSNRMYLNNVDQERITSSWWNWQRMIMHEMIHAAGNLSHADAPVSSCGSARSCDDIDVAWEDICDGLPGAVGSCGGSDTLCTWNSSNNIMESGGAEQRALSPCQWSRFYSKTLQRAYAKVACVKSGTDLIVAPGTTNWSTSRFISQDIIVPAMSKLEIECTVYLVGGAVISVERGGILDVDGGTLTRLCNDTEWQGIIVEGNNSIDQPDPDGTPFSTQAGIVKLRNNATIHGAHTGVYTARYNKLNNSIEGWNASYRGGVIKSEDSRFIDNRKSVAFMEYNFDNKSSFKRTDFDNTNAISGNEGVTIWRCDGIEFRDNTFSNIFRSGIFGINYSADIFDGNTFSNCEYGIKSEGATPFNDGFYIADNQFTNNTFYGIFLGQSGTASTRSYIEGNSVDSPGSGYGVAGNSRYTLKENFASGVSATGYGVRVIGTQDDFFNSIECNGIETFWTGMYLQGDNQLTRTEGNNIEDISYGIYYRDFNAEAGRLQSQTNPRNCFDVNGTYELRSAGMVSSCGYVSNTSVPCEVVQTLGSGWSISSGPFGSSTNCAPSQLTGSGSGNTALRTSSNPSHQHSSVHYHQVPNSDEVSAFKVNLPEIVGKKEVDGEVGSDRSFSEGHAQVLEIVKSRDSEKLYDFAKSTRNVFLQQLSYGALVHLRDFKAARRLLGLMEAPSQDFKRIQEIVLDFRSNEKDFRLDRESENFLSELARGDEGQIDDILYAQSILYLTKGWHFGDIYDAPHDREIEGRSGSFDNTSAIPTITSIAPNPVQDSRFELFVGTDLDLAPSTLIITNSVGEVISRSAITADQMVVDLPQGNPGVYFISLLSDEGEILKSLRFARLK